MLPVVHTRYGPGMETAFRIATQFTDFLGEPVSHHCLLPRIVGWVDHHAPARIGHAETGPIIKVRILLQEDNYPCAAF